MHTLIKHSLNNYAFILQNFYLYEIKKTIISFALVQLNDQPDWEFMESYIKSLPYADRI